KKEVEEFLDVLCEKSFQEALGRILAADAFSGNPDRMFAAYKEFGFPESSLKGWYHEKNLLIRNGAPVAIDNCFKPYPPSPRTGPFGAYAPPFQWGSIAPAFKTHALKEAGLIFDFLIQTAKTNNPDKTDLIDNKSSQKNTFAENVS